METHDNFVFASVKGDYGDFINRFVNHAVLISVPKELRIERVKNRSFEKFGTRMLPGGDLYEQEERFFDFVKSRDENTVTEWMKSLQCNVIQVDGTLPIDENVEFLVANFS